MRIVWVPSILDSLLPFILGIAEFVLADMLQPELRHLWFYLIAAVFAPRRPQQRGAPSLIQRLRSSSPRSANAAAMTPRIDSSSS